MIQYYYVLALKARTDYMFCAGFFHTRKNLKNFSKEVIKSHLAVLIWCGKRDKHFSRTTAVDSISVRNLSSNNTVNLSTYTWDKSGLVSLNMPLKGRWSITYGYSKDISFTPTISLYYAYPVTSTYVEDDVVIIQ